MSLTKKVISFYVTVSGKIALYLNNSLVLRKRCNFIRIHRTLREFTV